MAQFIDPPGSHVHYHDSPSRDCIIFVPVSYNNSFGIHKVVVSKKDDNKRWYLYFFLFGKVKQKN